MNAPKTEQIHFYPECITWMSYQIFAIQESFLNLLSTYISIPFSPKYPFKLHENFHNESLVKLPTFQLRWSITSSWIFLAMTNTHKTLTLKLRTEDVTFSKGYQTCITYRVNFNSTDVKSRHVTRATARKIISVANFPLGDGIKAASACQ